MDQMQPIAGYSIGIGAKMYDLYKCNRLRDPSIRFSGWL